MLPQARREGLLIEEVDDELIIYDQQRHRAHLLNPTAALVWKHCDGATTSAQLCALLRRKLNLAADEDLLELALDRLARAHLLLDREARPPHARKVSRRAVLQKLRLAGKLALLLPVVATITAPTPLMAASGNPAPACTLIMGLAVIAAGFTGCTKEQALQNAVGSVCFPVCQTMPCPAPAVCLAQAGFHNPPIFAAVQVPGCPDNQGFAVSVNVVGCDCQCPMVASRRDRPRTLKTVQV